MLATRRVVTTDDSGDEAEDFVAGDIIQLPKRRVGDESRVGYEARVVKLEAVAVLTRLGWSAEKIGTAVGYTGRNVRVKRRMLRGLRAHAEASGRV